MKGDYKLTLPDIQQTEPMIKLPIAQVGVENVEVPFLLELKSGGFRQIVANVSIRTNLNSNEKGISMSRLLLTLKPYLDVPLKRTLIQTILNDLVMNVETTKAFIRFDFKLPLTRHSPISDNSFVLFYKCRFEGQFSIENQNHADEFDFFQGVKIQYASYCPCSAGLCEHLARQNKQGFPHAQRSFTDILVRVQKDKYVWLEDIIHSVEGVLPTLPYPVIKRIDEQEIARIAGSNPMFVEDAIRAISQTLYSNDDLADWIVKCSHEESIHTSEAIAINWKGVPYGFNGNYYL